VVVSRSRCSSVVPIAPCNWCAIAATAPAPLLACAFAATRRARPPRRSRYLLPTGPRRRPRPGSRRRSGRPRKPSGRVRPALSGTLPAAGTARVPSRRHGHVERSLGGPGSSDRNGAAGAGRSPPFSRRRAPRSAQPDLVPRLPARFRPGLTRSVGAMTASQSSAPSAPPDPPTPLDPTATVVASRPYGTRRSETPEPSPAPAPATATVSGPAGMARPARASSIPAASVSASGTGAAAAPAAATMAAAADRSPPLPPPPPAFRPVRRSPQSPPRVASRPGVPPGPGGRGGHPAPACSVRPQVLGGLRSRSLTVDAF
jgi:hypothetical protein